MTAPTLESASGGDRPSVATTPGAVWHTPGGGESQGLVRYLEAIKAGRWIIVGAVVACLAAAALYLAQASKVYEATTDVLITPQSTLTVPVSGVIVQSSDPTRDVETVARLITSTTVARRVREELRLTDPVPAVLQDVAASPIAQSNIVTVAADAGSPEAAKQLSDAFAQQFVAERNARLRETLAPQIRQLEATVEAAGSQAAVGENSPRAQLQQLNALNRSGDPSVSIDSLAELPASAKSPRPALTIAAALIGGGVLGLLGAFGLQLLDPRLRREEQLRARFRLPILARIPLEKRKRKRPLLPSELSLAALDGYTALRAALTTERRDALAGRVVLMTGPTPGDGKTTAAINLASVLAVAGKRVILVEADSRRPSIGRALDMQAKVGLASVITGQHYLVDALLPVGDEHSRLRVLLTSESEAPAADVLSHLSVDTLLLQARRLADWVIVDSPPLNHVAETMAIARGVDDVLITCRVGNTNVRELDELAEMLAQQDIVPAGFVVMGGHARQGYY